MAAKAGGPPAFFVFGDSLVDSGNNNYLLTLARADSPPYGIDSPSHKPSGRFSNGLNFPDLLGEAMGLNPIFPYLSPELNGQKLLNGANFASAGIGILNDTGIQFANIVRIHKQFELFEEYQQKVCAIMGAEEAKQLVNKAIVLITLGGNDFVNNYFLPTISIRRHQFSIPDFCNLVISEYQIILLKLYELGARRIIVTGTGPLGCVPAELAYSGSKNGECAAEPQKASSMFNSMLFEMLKGLNTQVGSDVFIGTNAFNKNLDMIVNPKQFGFVSSTIACCGQGIYNGIGTCTTLSNLCSNRDEYLFWDAYHPTEKANRIIVQQLMAGSNTDIFPMNLSSIMATDANL
ncbi:GDSL esterase/lipase At4g28780 [Euphorbia peplus]|nr:GDSL esterase/lipase At4g28780 [Euphorbia peplus]